MSTRRHDADNFGISIIIVHFDFGWFRIIHKTRAPEHKHTPTHKHTAIEKRVLLVQRCGVL